MLAAVIILSIICMVLLLLLIGEKVSIRKTIREIETRKAGDTNMPLPLAVPDRDIEKMIACLNDYIEQYQTKLSYYVNHDTDFKRQIANISHDLRTPLTSIIGYVQLIQKNSTPEMNTEYLNIVEKKAQLLKSLIAQFYDLSRLDGDEYDLKPERLEVRTMISQAMVDYYNEFEQAGFEVEVVLPDHPVYIMADGKGMMRIFHNLLQNVLKHGKDYLKVGAYCEKGKVKILFENDALPLDETEVAHLFDRFYTADRMRTGQNTGLGLAIVKAMAEHMNQKIEAVYAKGRLKIILTSQMENEYRNDDCTGR